LILYNANAPTTEAIGRRRRTAATVTNPGLTFTSIPLITPEEFVRLPPIDISLNAIPTCISVSPLEIPAKSEASVPYPTIKGPTLIDPPSGTSFFLEFQYPPIQ